MDLHERRSRDRVRRGAAFLDSFRPGWFTEINTDTLRIESPWSCVLAQLYGTFCTSFSFNDAFDKRTIELGFASDVRHWNLVTDQWKREIQKRLAQTNPLFSSRSLSTLKSIFKTRRYSIQTRALAFAEYTARFYNSTNRAFSEERGNCVYEPLFDHEGNLISCGCAIGQHVKTGLEGCEMGIYGVWTSHRKQYLPGWMLDFSVFFLELIQQFHDDPHNWNESGLSRRGEEDYRSLLHYINTRGLSNTEL